MRSNKGDRREAEEDACTGCHLFDTKLRESDNDQIDGIVEEIARIRSEQRAAGGQINLSEISSLVWEGLIIWHREEAAIETDFKRQTGAIFRALLKLG